MPETRSKSRVTSVTMPETRSKSKRVAKTIKPPKKRKTNPPRRNSRKSLIRDPQPHKHLTEFPLFSKLPTELRLKIFKSALPAARMIQIDIRSVECDRQGLQRKLAVEFTIDPRRDPFRFCDLRKDKAGDWLSSLRDVGLLGTCMESRAVFIKELQNDMPIGQHGKIRFGDETLIWVTNLSRVVFHEEYIGISKSGDELGRLPSWLTNIKRLAIEVLFLSDPTPTYVMRPGFPLFDGYGSDRMQMLSPFRNLTELVGVEDVPHYADWQQSPQWTLGLQTLEDKFKAKKAAGEIHIAPKLSLMKFENGSLVRSDSRLSESLT